MMNPMQQMHMQQQGMGGIGASPIQSQILPPQQQPQHPIQQMEKLDNITKVKSLIGPLRESLSATIKNASQALQLNHATDVGTIKGLDTITPRFDKHLEEFYSICDQIELHLKTAKLCMQQAANSHQYLPIGITATRLEPIPPESGNTLSFTQYLDLVKMQINYTKDIHDTLICAPQNISPSE
uniref:Mediator of RNA polymerase II transcription subunit 29 n=1 Tax=Corethrella appendiculata TaxID=1370023 RepID=U5ENQ5_9DIPT